jgi:hypothetical protein
MWPRSFLSRSAGEQCPKFFPTSHWTDSWRASKASVGPCAWCCDKPQTKTNAGTMITPPPLPIRPRQIPAIPPKRTRKTGSVMCYFLFPREQPVYCLPLREAWYLLLLDWANNEHRAGRVTYDAFGDTAHEQMCQAGAALRAHDDKINVAFSGKPTDLYGGLPHTTSVSPATDCPAARVRRRASASVWSAFSACPRKGSGMSPKARSDRKRSWACSRTANANPC